jgi:hypothetical protein
LPGTFLILANPFFLLADAFFLLAGPFFLLANAFFRLAGLYISLAHPFFRITGLFPAVKIAAKNDKDHIGLCAISDLLALSLCDS